MLALAGLAFLVGGALLLAITPKVWRGEHEKMNRAYAAANSYKRGQLRSLLPSAVTCCAMGVAAVALRFPDSGPAKIILVIASLVFVPAGILTLTIILGGGPVALVPPPFRDRDAR